MHSYLYIPNKGIRIRIRIRIHIACGTIKIQILDGQNSDSGNRMECHAVTGLIYREMRSAHACFKYALRKCRLGSMHIRNVYLLTDISNRNKSKSTLSTCCDSITVESGIANL